MPIVSSYTELELAQFMDATIGSLAGVLGWALTTSPAPAPGSYQRAVNEALRLYGLAGAETIAAATDTAKLEAAARLAVWQAASDAAAFLMNTNVGGQGLNQSDIVEHIGTQLKRARAAALRYGLGGYSIGRRGSFHDPDPYEVSQ